MAPEKAMMPNPGLERDCNVSEAALGFGGELFLVRFSRTAAAGHVFSFLFW